MVVAVETIGSLATLLPVGGVGAVATILLSLEMPNWTVVAAVMATCLVLALIPGFIMYRQYKRNFERHRQAILAVAEFFSMQHIETQERTWKTDQDVINVMKSLSNLVTSLQEHKADKLLVDELGSRLKRLELSTHTSDPFFTHFDAGDKTH